jgi:RNA polymerase sigma-70 factor (ECF subfamily)
MSMERRVRFELLYGEHAPAVKAYILRRAQASVADDLVAEVFMVCWRRLDELPAEPLPWLLGVARRVLSTQRRGERRRVALHRRLAEGGAAVGSVEAVGLVEAMEATSPAGGSLAPAAEALPPTAGSPSPVAGTLQPAVDFAGEGTGGALRGALAQLSESDREVLTLIAWEGLSPTQAAAALGVKAATVRVRLHRARRRLARALVREGGKRGEAGEGGEPLPCTPLTLEAP